MVNKKVFAACLLGAFLLTGCGSEAGTGNALEAESPETESAEEAVSEVAETTENAETQEVSLENMETARTIKLDKSNIQTFNDTNGDGFLEFQ